MPASTGSTMSSSLPSLSPSPRGSTSTASSSAAVAAAAIPAPPPPPPAPPVKERKKPGPKPKPKVQPSKVIKLTLKSELLARFPHPPIGKAKSAKGSSPPTAQVSPGRDGSSPVNSDATPVPPLERPRGIPGPKPGSKRGRQPGALLGRPGRKKTKLDTNASPASSMNGVTHHANHGKLGPKANQGAINAQLRALDRTGKPCKRWSKATFSLKSFTGVQWSIPTWGAPASDQSAPPTPPPGGQAEDASAAPSVTSETPEIRVHPEAMNVDSEPGNHFTLPFSSGHPVMV